MPSFAEFIFNNLITIFEELSVVNELNVLGFHFDIPIFIKRFESSELPVFKAIEYINEIKRSLKEANLLIPFMKYSVETLIFIFS